MRPPAYSLYEQRRRPVRRGLGRSTGTRPSGFFAWQLTVEGIGTVLGAVWLLLYLQRITTGR